MNRLTKQEMKSRAWALFDMLYYLGLGKRILFGDEVFDYVDPWWRLQGRKQNRRRNGRDNA